MKTAGQRPGNTTETWNKAQKLHPKGEPAGALALQPAEGLGTAVWRSERPWRIHGKISKDEPLNSNLRVLYMCTFLERSPSPSSEAQRDPGFRVKEDKKEGAEKWNSMPWAVEQVGSPFCMSGFFFFN